MKLISFNLQTPHGYFSRIGAIIGEDALDLTLAYAAYLAQQGNTERCYEVADATVPPDMLEFLRGGQLSHQAAKNALDFALSSISANKNTLGPKGERMLHKLSVLSLLAPVPQPNSIRDTISFETHAKNFEKRTGKPIPELWYQQPIYYKGNTRTVTGHEANIQWPAYTKKFDYELEFGIYIGKTGKNISVEDAHEYIAGYTIFNDFSARDVLQSEITMLLGPAKGKDMDTGNVMGPCMVTPDELDPTSLKMTAHINGELWSQGNSSDMYWSFAQIIAHISLSETLYPGDFIGSGTIAFGCGDELDRWLSKGDLVELEVEGIGILRNRVI